MDQWNNLVYTSIFFIKSWGYDIIHSIGYYEGTLKQNIYSWVDWHMWNNQQIYACFLITSEIKEELKIAIVKVLDEMDYFCVLLDISVYTSWMLA